MHSIKRLSMCMLQGALLVCSTYAVASDVHDHRQEHGGQIYQLTTLDNQWQKQDQGAAWQSQLKTRIGTDENKLVIQLKRNKIESTTTAYDAKMMYSRNIADFWDAQWGLRYLNDQAAGTDSDQLDAVFGLHGMAPYFFETDAYLFVGEDQRVSLSLETERDLLLTQQLILKPHLALDLVISDDTLRAKKTGLDQANVGVEIRYELSKKIMPFIDMSYAYRQGQTPVKWQPAVSSERTWLYGIGLRLKF